MDLSETDPTVYQKNQPAPLFKVYKAVSQQSIKGIGMWTLKTPTPFFFGLLFLLVSVWNVER
jgi:hypothetical protein